MNVEEQKRIVIGVLDFFRRNFPEQAKLVHPHPDDPGHLCKPQVGSDLVSIRLLPVNRSPKPFWNPKWCFYQISAGQVPSSCGPQHTSGAIRFVQFPNQKVCGSGRHLSSVLQILQEIAVKHPSWQFDTPHSTGGAGLFFGALYGVVRHPVLPVPEAAADLADLISQTLPPFAALR